MANAKCCPNSSNSRIIPLKETMILFTKRNNFGEMGAILRKICVLNDFVYPSIQNETEVVGPLSVTHFCYQTL